MIETTPSTLSERNLLLVIGGVMVAAYFTFFTNTNMRDLSIIQLAALFGLGLAYLIIGFRGWDLCEQTENEWYFATYFTTQLIIVFLLMQLDSTTNFAFWMLLLPLVGQSVTLPKIGAAAVFVACWGTFGLALWVAGVNFNEIISAIVAITSAMAFVLIFSLIAVREAEAREEIEHLATQLSDANQQLRQYAAQAEALATTMERNRLAREIHDSLGHYLTVINMQLNAAQAVLPHDLSKATESVAKAQSLAQEGLAEVRRSVATLRESPVEKRPLPEAIANLINSTTATGIATELTVKGEPRHLSPQAKHTLYRAAQEGLTNARKYAQASYIHLLLDYAQNNWVHLIIRDDGIGSPNTQGGFGLLGLQERVNLLGGKLAIETAVDAGFTLTVAIPDGVST